MFKLKFKIYFCSTLLMLGGMVVSERAEALCSATVTNLNFGNINPITQTGPVDVTATVDYRCVGLLIISPTRVWVCIEIGPSPGETSAQQRFLTHALNLSEKRGFNIYKEAARQNIWGYQDESGATPMTIDHGRITLGLLTPVSGTVQIYGKLNAEPSFMLNETGTYNANMDVRVKMAAIEVLNLTSCADLGLTGNATLAATATLDKACTISATPLNFGSHPSNFSSVVQSTSTINTACSKGSNYQIGLNNGQNAIGATRRMKAADGSYISYELYNNSSYTQRWGSTKYTSEVVQGIATGQNQQATVYGQVQPQPGLKAATYEDTITVTVTY